MTTTNSRIGSLTLAAVLSTSALWHLPAATAQTDSAAAQTQGMLTIGVGKPGVRINPLLYGLMTEEINHSYDGGLYAELIQNRILKDDPKNPVHWSAVTKGNSSAAIALDSDHPASTALTTSLRLDVTSASSTNAAGVANDGYWGIPVTPNTMYKASFYARASEGFHGPLTAAIESKDGATVFASAQIVGVTTAWKKFTVELKTSSVAPSTANRFTITTTTPG
jgi:alpha-N-arabinofuranosidase